jgi:short-chain Z-isoprenyl diphosphate synthase
MARAASREGRPGRLTGLGRLTSLGRRGLTRAAAPVYALYTERLRHEVAAAGVPRHVAVILDGNRRWARELGADEPGAGHRRGADKVDELVAWCRELGIAEVTVWALSNENLARPADELEPLIDVICAKVDALEAAAASSGTPMRIRLIGRLEGMPPRLRELAARVEERTARNAGLALSIAIGYSGRDELIDACRTLVGELAASGVAADAIAEGITRESLAARLYTAGGHDPDLIIRTSGEQRLSGFLPWQSANSELYFAEAYWPAFRELDFLRALRTYQQRSRRFGA